MDLPFEDDDGSNIDGNLMLLGRLKVPRHGEIEGSDLDEIEKRLENVRWNVKVSKVFDYKCDAGLEIGYGSLVDGFLLLQFQ